MLSPRAGATGGRVASPPRYSTECGQLAAPSSLVHLARVAAAADAAVVFAAAPAAPVVACRDSRTQAVPILNSPVSTRLSNVPAIPIVFHSPTPSHSTPHRYRCHFAASIHTLRGLCAILGNLRRVTATTIRLAVYRRPGDAVSLGRSTILHLVHLLATSIPPASWDVPGSTAAPAEAASRASVRGSVNADCASVEPM